MRPDIGPWRALVVSASWWSGACVDASRAARLSVEPTLSTNDRDSLSDGWVTATTCSQPPVAACCRRSWLPCTSGVVSAQLSLRCAVFNGMVCTHGTGQAQELNGENQY